MSSSIESLKSIFLGTVVVGNGAIVVSDNEVINIEVLENMVFWGVTFGAWVKIFLFLSVILVVFGRLNSGIEGILKWYDTIQERRKKKRKGAK